MTDGSRTKVRWIAVGNQATGFIAFGNIVTGVIAVGNVARGVIAIGNVAVGLVAIGNVGFGVLFGAGASVGVGLFVAAGAVSLPVLHGFFESAARPVEEIPLLAVAPIFAWLVAAVVLRGARSEPPPPAHAATTTLAKLRDAADEQGWVRARVTAFDGQRIELRDGHASLRAEPEAGLPVDRPSLPRTFDAMCFLHAQERPGEGTGYREAVPVVRAFVCSRVVALEPRPPLWATADDVQWLVRRIWIAGVVVGLAAFVAKVLLAA